MVRISHAWIWSEWIGDLINESACMCCKKTKIHRLPIKKKHDWVRGHIIPDKRDKKTNKKPREMVENIWPICVDCNEKDKTFTTNLHYSCHLGVIGKQEVKDRLKKIREILEEGIVKICRESYCNNVAHGQAQYCRVHEYGITPTNLYNYLLYVQKGMKKKVFLLKELKEDTFWGEEEKAELVQLYNEDLASEVRILKSFGMKLC